MAIELNIRTKTIIGAGSITKVVDYLSEHEYKSVGIIYDRGLEQNEYLMSFITSIEQKGLVSVKYKYDLPFEPDYDSLDRVRLLFKNGMNSRVDIIIAIGGGSVMDFGKGIATLITNHEPALTYRGFPKNINPSIPLIAIPSTAGTASEVTYNAVFTDNKSGKKLGINTHNNFPAVAVLDSNVTKGCPYHVALSAGLDALVHTLESFACNNHNYYTRIFAKEAFKYLFNNIESALNDPSADMAREFMLFGAYLAGISLCNAGSGPAGALSYPMGVIFKIPHGIAGGFVLPFLIKHNVDKGYLDYAVLYDQINHADTGLTVIEKSQRLAELFFELYERLKVWEQLSAYQIDLENTAFKEYVGALQPAFNQNPVEFNISDAFCILREINAKK